MGDSSETVAQDASLRSVFIVSGRRRDDMNNSMKDYRSAVQEAVWWMPNEGKATILLGNASDVPISVSLKDSTDDAQMIELAPFATEALHRENSGQGNSSSSSSGSVESLKLEVSGPMGYLRATGFITSHDKRFTSAIRFYDPGTIQQPHLFATNFRVKGSVSHLVLKNTTDAVLSAKPRFLPLSGESK
jgi:hypothetical protein